VEVEFFHGRGGTVARGGGRAYEALLALPPGTVRGRVRVTEQGEVISAKYADPEIAGRNLELALSGLLLATLGLQPAPAPAGALRPMRPSTTGPAVLARLSADSLAAYRQLLTPELLAYFWRATPVAELGQLNLGSRPSFRARQPDFHNLRAIPWVFAWTQNRALLPAWYGLGTALVAELARRGGRRRLQLLYRQWGFFRDLMDNAEMALAKTDLPITRAYQSLAPDPAAAERMAADWEQEFARAVRGVLAITGEKDLLDRSPVLARSIRLRNPYVDPLSLLQVGLLARQRQAAAGGGTGNEGAERGGPAGGQESAWDAGSEQALLLTLQGIAAGMRNTG
jgi:phosphoenolpyruvate carboxylase